MTTSFVTSRDLSIFDAEPLRDAAEAAQARALRERPAEIVLASGS
jgi:hypothetical protein